MDGCRVLSSGKLPLVKGGGEGIVAELEELKIISSRNYG